MNNKGTVLVGMSGGVDSSVVAYLLKNEGYKVIGITMETFDNEGVDSPAKDAKMVADILGIEHYVLDFRKEFKECVVDNFVAEYVNGRTPNPCCRCNRFVKWQALLDRFDEFGADFVATGHYANIKKLESGRYAVAKSATDKKDQTYALYNLTQEQLSHTLFPLGNYEKDAVREIAINIKNDIAKKKDSQEICFIPDDDYGRFLMDCGIKLPPTGDFVHKSGEILGQHKGIHHYTIGQRKGLGIAYENPLYVYDIDTATNEVRLGDNEDVFFDHLYCRDVNYMGAGSFNDGDRVIAKIRYGGKPEYCTITNMEDGILRCDFENPVRAVTPGQAVVFYKDDYVLGGGTIIKK